MVGSAHRVRRRCERGVAVEVDADESAAELVRGAAVVVAVAHVDDLRRRQACDRGEGAQ